MNNIETELNQIFDKSIINGFWELVESLDWDNNLSIKNKLLKELSPSQASCYKKILDFICDNIAEDISRESSFKNVFDLKSIASNIIGESSYEGFISIIDNPDKVTDRLQKEGTPSIDSIFLFMFPDDDDYWNI